MPIQSRCRDYERAVSSTFHRLAPWLTPDLLGITFCVALAAGCSNDGLVPVSGTVTYNGKPLTRGEIVFIPNNMEAGSSGRAQIGSGGKYSMTTFQLNDGCLPGDYSVAVFCYEEPPAPTKKELADPNPPAAPKMGVPAIPEKYLDPKKSGLTAKVGNSKTVVDFDLK